MVPSRLLKSQYGPDDLVLANHNLTVADYQRIAWQDFISQQIDAFGDIPIYLAIRNHELVPGLSYRQ